MGSLKWPMLMIHTSTQITAIALDKKLPNSSNFFFKGVISSVVSAMACLQYQCNSDMGHNMCIAIWRSAEERISLKLLYASPCVASLLLRLLLCTQVPSMAFEVRNQVPALLSFLTPYTDMFAVRYSICKCSQLPKFAEMMTGF